MYSMVSVGARARVHNDSCIMALLRVSPVKRRMSYMQLHSFAVMTFVFVFFNVRRRAMVALEDIPYKAANVFA